MFRLIDILTYAVLLGCEFIALCAMVRDGRGRISTVRGLVALAVLTAVDVVMECVWNTGSVPSDLWLAVQFTATWAALSGLTIWLSHDCLGRRIFLALCYGSYALGYAACFDVIVYRPLADVGGGGAPVWSIAAGLAVVTLLNLIFVRWILPCLPRDGRDFRWRDSCLVAGVMFAAMFASSLWPVSVTSAPVRDCAPFVLVSVAAWIVFPMVCGRMRDRQRAADIAHSLELMMAEVKERRAAIDLARRLRHDQRHHRAQIAEYMLAGQYERVFDYLKALDEEAQEAPTNKLVWCENETINAILSGAFRRATAQNISLEVEVHVERTFPLPAVQLVAVLANLIENAIEATSSNPPPNPQPSTLNPQTPTPTPQPPIPQPSTLNPQPSTPNPLVRVCLRQREHGLGITVTNPVPVGFALSNEGLPCAEPGVGLESIRRVVERHDGQWSYELNEGILKCQVILMFPLKPTIPTEEMRLC